MKNEDSKMLQDISQLPTKAEDKQQGKSQPPEMKEIFFSLAIVFKVKSD